MLTARAAHLLLRLDRLRRSRARSRWSSPGASSRASRAGCSRSPSGSSTTSSPAERRSVAIGMISAMFGIGGGIGLPLSGAIVDNTDISWLFWIGLLALPAAFLVHRVVPPSPARERTRIDWGGAALLSLGLAALLLGISKANAWGWGVGEDGGGAARGRRRPRRLRRVRAAPQPAARRHAGPRRAPGAGDEHHGLPHRRGDVRLVPHDPAVRAGAGVDGLRVRHDGAAVRAR